MLKDPICKELIDYGPFDIMHINNDWKYESVQNDNDELQVLGWIKVGSE